MNLWISTASAAESELTSPGHSAPEVAVTWFDYLRKHALGTATMWQWEHRTGFRNYNQNQVGKIEDAYQKGFDTVRIKAGKTNAPMEIFFADMIQHDPISGNTRRIRRLGFEGWFKLVLRFIRRYFRILCDGQRRDFQSYSQLRKDIHSGISHHVSAKQSLVKVEGLCARISRSSWFFSCSMCLVVLNAMWISIDADRDMSPRVHSVPLHVVALENFFCASFTVEILIRFWSYPTIGGCFKDGWWCFDCSLVALMVLETWFIPIYVLAFHTGSDSSTGTGDWIILRIGRILRLSRLGRIARLLRAMPEVYMLLKGIATAIRSVFVTLLLLCALLLLFGVVFRQQAADDEVLGEIFPSVRAAMWLLLLHGTFLDTPSILLNQLGGIQPMLAAVLLVYIFLSSFTVLNMLIGILVGVVNNVAEHEKEQAAVHYLKTTMLDILDCHDHDGDCALGREEFELLMRNPEVHIVLSRFGVDMGDLLSLKDRLFDGSRGACLLDNSLAEDSNGTSLQVIVIRARGLRAADISWFLHKGKSDPYCICEIPGKANAGFRTKTVSCSQEPTWNHLEVVKPFEAGDSLRLTVWDEDWCKEDDFLGRATLNSGDFHPCGFAGEVPLFLPGGGAGGYLQLKVEVIPPLQSEADEFETVEGPKLSFQHFLEAVMRLRGGNRATVHDVVELRCLLLDQFRRLHTALGPLSSHPSQSPRHSAKALKVASYSPSAMRLARTSLPGEVPDNGEEDPVLRRLSTLESSQQELRSELKEVKSLILELKAGLESPAPRVESHSSGLTSLVQMSEIASLAKHLP